MFHFFFNFYQNNYVLLINNIVLRIDLKTSKRILF